MILTDTGPLVALLNADDQYHRRCVATLRTLEPDTLLTTWVCFTEAMYLLGAIGGYHYQKELWELQKAGKLAIRELTPDETSRMRELMEQYQDTPMDLADASLVAVAESSSLRAVFTNDRDFEVYRLWGTSALHIYGGPLGSSSWQP